MIVKRNKPTTTTAAFNRPLVNTNRRKGLPGNALLTMQDARDMRAAYAAGEANMRELGKRYGISHSCVSQVINQKSYRDEAKVSKTRAC